jgi:hypothetical protein
MAKTQTRRSISVSRAMYEAATKLAAERGMSLSHLTELALQAAGVPAAPKSHVAARPVEPPRLVVHVPNATHEPPKRTATVTPLVPRATFAAMATKARLAGFPPGTSCANCIDAPATHVGKVDKSSNTYPLCNACELPDDAKEISRFR